MRLVKIEPQAKIQPPPRSYAEIDRDEIVRQALEEAAKRLERRDGNATYRRAWEISAALLRAMKP